MSRALHISRRGLVVGTGACLALPARAEAPAGAGAPDRPSDSGYAYLGGRIDESAPRRLLGMLQSAIASRIGRLTLVLNTPGGDVGSGLAAYQILRSAPLDLTTYNIGSVGSIGVFVYLAGARRVAHPRSSFLLHGIDSGEKVSREDEELRAVSYRKELAIIRDRTTISEADFAEMMRGYRIFSAEEARAATLATEVSELRFPFGDRLLD